MPEPDWQPVSEVQARALHVRLQQDRRSWVSVEIPALDTYCLTVIQQAEQIAKVLALHDRSEGDAAWDLVDSCEHCSELSGFVPWPCDTARALGVTDA